MTRVCGELGRAKCTARVSRSDSGRPRGRIGSNAADSPSASRMRQRRIGENMDIASHLFYYATSPETRDNAPIVSRTETNSDNSRPNLANSSSSS